MISLVELCFKLGCRVLYAHHIDSWWYRKFDYPEYYGLAREPHSSYDGRVLISFSWKNCEPAVDKLGQYDHWRVVCLLRPVLSPAAVPSTSSGRQ